MMRRVRWMAAVALLAAACGGGGGGGSDGSLLPVIGAFGAMPSTVAPGGRATLSWTVTGADSLSIDQGVGDVTARTSVEVGPSGNTQYTLSATNAHGTRTAVTVVQVAGACEVAYQFPLGPTFQIPGTTTMGTLARTIPWQPGVPGGIPHRTQICARLSPSGGNDDAAITAALGACPEGQVVQLEKGTFRLEKGIRFPRNNVTLRGMGGPGTPDGQRTRLLASATMNTPIVTLSAEGYPQLWGAGAAGAREAELAAPALQGSTTLKLAAGGASRFAVGDLVIVDQETDPDNDAMFAAWNGVDPNATMPWSEWAAHTRDTYALWPLGVNGDGTPKVKFPYAMFDADMPPGVSNRGNDRRYDRPIAQVGELAAVDASTDTLTLRTPLHFTFAPALRARVAGTMVPGGEGVGMEDLLVTTEPPAPGNNNRGGISFGAAKRCWMRNVEVDRAGIWVTSSYQCTIRDSYVHEVHGLPTPTHYGILVRVGSSDNLIENNVVWNFDKVMTAPGSGPGNVYAYNYMDDGWLRYSPEFVESGMEASHGSTPTYGLFEGNLTFSLGTDATHGNNIFMTWLRNLATIHRAGWPPLNAYRWEGGSQPGDCVPPAGYDASCLPYMDWSNRVGAQAVFGNYYFSYVGNVLGSDDTPLAPQVGSAFVYDGTTPGVPIWDLGRFIAEGLPEQTDEAVTRTVWRDGNHDIATGATHREGSPQAIPASLYLCSKPAFFGSWQWPWVDGSAAAGDEYVRRPYQYYPLSPVWGTFRTPELSAGAQPTTTYQGYQLPAFARFLKLREIEGKLSDCAGSTVTSPTPECQLLLTGRAP